MTTAISGHAPTYDEACGWRVLRKRGGGAEIRISNIAVRDKPAYRVLKFPGGEFTFRDGASLHVSKDADTWTVSVAGSGYCRFPNALIAGG